MLQKAGDYKKRFDLLILYRFTDPETIRGKFGLTDTRNASHGSDSIITAEQE